MPDEDVDLGRGRLSGCISNFQLEPVHSFFQVGQLQVRRPRVLHVHWFGGSLAALLGSIAKKIHENRTGFKLPLRFMGPRGKTLKK